MDSTLSLFWIFLRLGLTSFGGPVAHLGYFRDEFVTRKRWLSDQLYADLVSLCQFLPGPASSQVGIGIGLMRRGLPGAVVAWLGFTLPSVVIMVLFAYGVSTFGDMVGAGWLQGLMIVAVAVVAQAILGMARTLTPDLPRITLAISAAIALLVWQTALMQVAVILAGGLIGWGFLRSQATEPFHDLTLPISRKFGLSCLGIFVLLFVGLPLAAGLIASPTAAVIDVFYRVGSLVFGGGHVVLPLLQAEVVPRGWVSQDLFLAGYGMAQGLPGPLFSFAAYLGAVMQPAPNGWLGGVLALTVIYLPSFLLVLGVLPFWSHLRRFAAMQNALVGINAAVVGLLLAAFIQPVLISSVKAPQDAALAIIAFVMLVYLKLPSWIVVVVGAGAGFLLSIIKI